MATHTAIRMRLKIYLRRECYVWLCRRTDENVNFGWILGYCDNQNIIFKDDEHAGSMVIPLQDIESCGAV